MACANLWHDWTISIIIITKRIFTRFQPWAPKRLVKWALGFTECVTYADINAPGDNKSVSLTTLNVSLMQTSMLLVTINQSASQHWMCHLCRHQYPLVTINQTPSQHWMCHLCRHQCPPPPPPPLVTINHSASQHWMCHLCRHQCPLVTINQSASQHFYFHGVNLPRHL